MASRKPTPRTLVQRTPVAEWVVAGLGLVLTLSAIGYSLYEAVSGEAGPPELQARVLEVHATSGGHVAEIEVSNSSRATAADVSVRAVLEGPGAQPETRELTFDYVPGRGVARGGAVFRQDPAAGAIRVEAETYADP
jgi:uncharacterized protein (TIGR02588 family)